VRVAHPLLGPFALLDARGELTGLSLDYLERIAARTGLRFEGVPVRDVAAAIAGVRDGRYHAVMGIGRMPDRQELLLLGEPVATSPHAIVVPSETPFLFDVRGVGGRRVALARSSTELMGRLAREVPRAQVVGHSTLEEALRASSDARPGLPRSTPRSPPGSWVGGAAFCLELPLARRSAGSGPGAGPKDAGTAPSG